MESSAKSKTVKKNYWLIAWIASILAFLAIAVYAYIKCLSSVLPMAAIFLIGLAFFLFLDMMDRKKLIKPAKLK